MNTRVIARRVILATITISSAAFAQSGRVTAAEYDQAVNMLGPNLTGLVIGGTVAANWLPAGPRFYRKP